MAACQLSWVAYLIFSFWWYGMMIFNDLETSENTHWPIAYYWHTDQCSQHIETSQLVCRVIRISLLMYMLHLKYIRFLLFLSLDSYEIPTGTPTLIRRRPDFDEFPRISTCFFDVISLIEKSTSFHVLFSTLFRWSKNPRCFYLLFSRQFWWTKIDIAFGNF